MAPHRPSLRKEKGRKVPMATETQDKVEVQSAEFLGSLLAGKVPADKKEEASPTPTVPAEAKAEDKPKEEDAKPAPKVDSKAEKQPVKEEKPKPEAEEENLAKLTKRLKDVGDYATRVNQQNVEVGRKLDQALHQITVLQQKIEGTYEEPKAEKPEAVAEKARMEAKVATSHFAAVEVYGEEAVNKMVWATDAPYRQFDTDPAIQARVANAKLPVLEAIKVVKEAELREKYGKDPEAMRAAIEKEVTEKLTKEITEKVEKELKKKAPVKIEPLAGLSGVTGAGREDQKASEDQPIKLESLFPNFTPSVGSS